MCGCGLLFYLVQIRSDIALQCITIQHGDAEEPLKVRLPWPMRPRVQSSRRSEAGQSWKGWNCAWAFWHHWFDTWVSLFPSESGMGSPPHSAYLGRGKGYISGWRSMFCTWPVGNCKGTSALPRKVVEMYSDTWFPERLISDKWDSSLFNILLNWGQKQAENRK